MNSQSPNDEIVVSRIKPQHVNSTGAVGDWVDMTLFQHVVFLFATGAMALEAVDCAIEVAEDSSGAGLRERRPARERRASRRLTPASIGAFP